MIDFGLSRLQLLYIDKLTSRDDNGDVGEYNGVCSERCSKEEVDLRIRAESKFVVNDDIFNIGHIKSTSL